MKTHDLFPFTLDAQFSDYYTLDMKKENNNLRKKKALLKYF